MGKAYSKVENHFLVSGGLCSSRFCESIVAHPLSGIAHDHTSSTVERDADFLAMFKNRLAVGVDCVGF
jgi:hypothetical protein